MKDRKREPGKTATIGLILLRHGETALNARRAYVGQADPPLNGSGWRQVVAAAPKLRSLVHTDGPPLIVSSDLVRARQTAMFIGEVSSFSAAWRELDFGKWTGKTYEQIHKSCDGERFRAWYDNPWEVSPPGGETLTELMVRVAGALDRALGFVQFRSDPPTLVIVTHGGPIRAVEAILRGRPRDFDTYWNRSLGTAEYIHHRLEMSEIRRAITAVRRPQI